jgi:hypothetical protein
MVGTSNIRTMTSMTSIPTIGSREIGIKIHTNTTRNINQRLPAVPQSGERGRG